MSFSREQTNKNYCPNCFSQISSSAVKCGNCGYSILREERALNGLPALSILKGRYMLGRTLGVGGFGITYIAKNLDNGNLVAIKEYFPCEFAMRNKDSSIVPIKYKDAYIKGMVRFYDEAGKLAELYDCPTVVKILDFFYENNTAYIVMEYIDGKTLRQFIKEQGEKIDYNDALKITIDVANALAKVHTHDILHRDVSPENIMISKDGKVRLIDFGASREYVKNQSQGLGLTVILKPGYAPPEQYSRKKKQGKYSDIYSLAATFYRIVTGQPVPDAQSRLTGVNLIPLKELEPYIPQRVSDAISKAMTLDYNLRQQTCEEFISDLLGSAARNSPVSVSTGRQTSASTGQASVSTGCQASVSPASASAQKEQAAYIRLYYGENMIKTYALPKNQTITVGRNPQKCHIAVKPEAMIISREHCKITWDPSRRKVYVCDTSSNGVFLIEAGGYLKHNETYAFPYGITLQLASTDVILQIFFN